VTTEAVDALGEATPPSTARHVSVCGPAQRWFVSAVRALAADLAGRADFDLDGIDDLRLAVDEACSCLLRLADRAEPLRCSFQVTATEIEVRVRVAVGQPDSTLHTGGFGWRVLTCLVDKVSTAREGDVLEICLLKAMAWPR
jgi:serine/threonine-protein kinase RsbW